MNMDGKLFRPFLYVKMSDNFYVQLKCLNLLNKQKNVLLHKKVLDNKLLWV